MSPRLVEALIALVMVAVLLAIAIPFFSEQAACERAGGTFAKTYDGFPAYECVDPR